MPSESIVFDRAAEYYDDTRGFPPGQETPSAALFVQAGHLMQNSRVLEIGIGTGRIALPLAPMVGTVYGVDLARPMMDRLRRKQTTERIELVEADATLLPFADHTFDAVVAVHIFHLIPTWRDVLTEVARVLKPGAMLLHGGNQRQTPQALDAVWQQIIQTFPSTQGSIRSDQRTTFLQEAGWREVGDFHQHTFSARHSPEAYVQALRERKWSHCWKMTDDELNAGLAALQEHIKATYADPSLPIDVNSEFHVQAYLPPA
ncbi:MAG: class I SAM-dependent methyltransferase [Anaerolineae bacterium]|nr:class I SAM-dependent methyltransferase [Anaerolineae bacterium]